MGQSASTASTSEPGEPSQWVGAELARAGVSRAGSRVSRARAQESVRFMGASFPDLGVLHLQYNSFRSLQREQKGNKKAALPNFGESGHRLEGA